MVAVKIAPYLGRQTVLAGDVNSGKTAKTTEILNQFLAAGYARDLAILDLAPDTVQGIGGKMLFEKDPGVLYLTGKIAAPRLMGKNETHTRELARDNAQTIETLFVDLERHSRDVLFINDLTLYLQAGNIDRILNVLQNSATTIINAYYGNSFSDSELTRRERQLTEIIMKNSDSVILT